MPPTFLIRKVGKRISHRIHTHLFGRKLLRFQGTFPELTFPSKKGKPKNFRTKLHPFIRSKAFWFPKGFSRKALWSGFGAEAPTDNAHKKARHCRAFYFINICWNCRSKPPLQGAFCKKHLKNPQKLL